MTERCNKCWRIISKDKSHTCPAFWSRKWHKTSEETKQKQRLAKIWKKLSPEHREKVIKTLLRDNPYRFKKWNIPKNKWIPHSKEVIEKMRNVKLWKKASEETKRKMSISQTGKEKKYHIEWWNEWMKMPKEYRLKLSLAHWWKIENFDNMEHRRYMRNKNNRMRKEITYKLWWHTNWEWELLKKQYNYCCPACGKKEPIIILTKDHIIPISKWGCNLIENIQPLCKRCNSVKSYKVIRFTP